MVSGHGTTPQCWGAEVWGRTWGSVSGRRWESVGNGIERDERVGGLEAGGWIYWKSVGCTGKAPWGRQVGGCMHGGMVGVSVWMNGNTGD